MIKTFFPDIHLANVNMKNPRSLFNIVKCFHTNTKATVQYDGNVSESFTIKSGVKQGCVLAPTLFGIFFSMLLNALSAYKL